MAKPNLDGELLRQLVVLKLWQVRDPFDVDGFFEKHRAGDYDWDDLRRLLRPVDRVEAKAIVDAIETHFRGLNDVTDLEREVIADARRGARNVPLGARLCDEVQRRFASGT